MVVVYEARDVDCMEKDGGMSVDCAWQKKIFVHRRKRVVVDKYCCRGLYDGVRDCFCHLEKGQLFLDTSGTPSL